MDFTREFVDPDIIPAIPKILSYDANTVKWNMKQVLLSKDLKRIEEVTKREAQALVDKWMDPSFMPLMKSYMARIKKMKKESKGKSPKASKQAKM